MEYLLKLLSLFSIYIAIVQSATTKSNLVAVVQLFRHGQRAPLSFYPTDPYSDRSSWSVELGQLDNVGKRQHYQLGTFTRNRYSELLTTTYDSTLFYAYTTDVDRTHMSAQANLAALWAPSGTQVWNENVPWQPVPVHPLDPRVLSSWDSCANFEQLYADAIGSSDLFAELNEEYIDVYQYITTNSGYTVSSVAGAGTIYDTLLIEDLNNMTLPSWTGSVYPEPLTTLAAYNWMGYSYTTPQKKISTGIFYRDLFAHFEAIATGNSSTYYKFKVYSGHDDNIAATLDTLGAFTPHSPYYASTIYFELRELNGKYFVNVWHKNQDTFEQITVKGCTLNCNLRLFKVLLAEYILDEAEYDSLCETSTKSTMTYGLSLTSASVHENVKDFLRLRGSPR